MDGVPDVAFLEMQDVAHSGVVQIRSWAEILLVSSIFLF